MKCRSEAERRIESGARSCATILTLGAAATSGSRHVPIDMNHAASRTASRTATRSAISVNRPRGLAEPSPSRRPGLELWRQELVAGDRLGRPRAQQRDEDDADQGGGEGGREVLHRPGGWTRPRPPGPCLQADVAHLRGPCGARRAGTTAGGTGVAGSTGVPSPRSAGHGSGQGARTPTRPPHPERMNPVTDGIRTVRRTRKLRP